MAAAITHAGTADPDRLADGFSQIANYPGVTGRISYARDTQIPVKSVTLIQIGNGRFRFVDEVTPTHVPQP